MSNRLLNFISKKYKLNLMAEQMEMDGTTEADAKTFIRAVCSKLDMPYDHVVGPSRTEPLAHIRSCIMYALATHGFTLKQCVWAVNRTNHTTAIYARDNVQDFIEMGDKKTMATIDTINEVLKETGWKQIHQPRQMSQ